MIKLVIALLLFAMTASAEAQTLPPPESMPIDSWRWITGTHQEMLETRAAQLRLMSNESLARGYAGWAPENWTAPFTGPQVMAGGGAIFGLSGDVDCMQVQGWNLYEDWVSWAYYFGDTVLVDIDPTSAVNEILVTIPGADDMLTAGELPPECYVHLVTTLCGGSTPEDWARMCDAIQECCVE
jgi:hypothetical protein